jgi:hypothetical protein
VLTLVALSAAPRGLPIKVSGRIQLSRSADASGAVVWLTPLDDPRMTPPQSSHRSRLLQKNKMFSPHVVVVPVGSAIEFPNQDPFFHNVFSLFEGKRFDLGLYEAGTTRTVVFDRPGISYIFCNIHPDMSAVVISLKTPYYGVSDSDGKVIIPDVPPGSYEMQAWHERALLETLKDITKRIVVSDASHTFGVLHLTEQRDFSQAHKNKYGKDYDSPTPDSPVYGSKP